MRDNNCGFAHQTSDDQKTNSYVLPAILLAIILSGCLCRINFYGDIGNADRWENRLAFTTCLTLSFVFSVKSICGSSSFRVSLISFFSPLTILLAAWSFGIRVPTTSYTNVDLLFGTITWPLKQIGLMFVVLLFFDLFFLSNGKITDLVKNIKPRLSVIDLLIATLFVAVGIAFTLKSKNRENVDKDYIIAVMNGVKLESYSMLSITIAEFSILTIATSKRLYIWSKFLAVFALVVLISFSTTAFRYIWTFYNQDAPSFKDNFANALLMFSPFAFILLLGIRTRSNQDTRMQPSEI
jgi:hypothetical protein